LILRAYKFPCYPDERQKAQLEIEFAAARAIFNWGLATRKGEYEKDKTRVSRVDCNKRLTQLKKHPDEYWPEHMGGTEWLKNASVTVLQYSLINLDTAYKNFFEGTAKYPQFKVKGKARNSVTYPISACVYLHEEEKLWLTNQYYRKMSSLKIKRDRKLPTEPIKVTVSKDRVGNYFISFLVKEDIDPLPKTGKVVGVDVGITDVVITDDGYKSGNPKSTAKYAKKLKKLQRQKRLKEKGSNNQEKLRIKIAKVHKKIADTRLTFLHRESKRLVDEADIISVESLNVQGMMKNRKLSKAIADASMSEFHRQLEYKSQFYGRNFVSIDKWFPSTKTCSSCHHVVDSIPLSDRSWECPECGVKHDRDINAAINIKEEGLRILNNA